MSKGGGIAGVAVVLILLLAAVSGYWLGRTDSGRWASPNGSNYDACENGDYNRCKTQPVVLDPVDGEYRPANPNDQSYRNEYRDERDLAAQREMATWARAAFFTSLIGVGLLFVTWNATAQGVKETRRIGETQVQAYLICNAGSLRLRKVDYEGIILQAPNFNLPIVNKGQSPGRNVNIECTIRLVKVSGPGRAYSIHSEDVMSFCADVAPSSEETAIFEMAAIRSGTHVSSGELVWMSIEGRMFWMNEFGGLQEQSINLVSPPFNWPADASPPSKDPLPMKGIGRRDMLLGRQQQGGTN